MKIWNIRRASVMAAFAGLAAFSPSASAQNDAATPDRPGRRESPQGPTIPKPNDPSDSSITPARPGRGMATRVQESPGDDADLLD